ncbi:S8 family serine peptidase [Pontibacter sp. Tf4]|uniref:S8 family peptidase n=1 Tax=Pontibacter sp. Tf4 TaxID=2761620 RepID=UPI001627A9E3|nr:S8 family serine peptidase [Pontibacter sp. Tf4]MBB6610625.1 S8 family serine peptidase [Pontibacter sp. Tf4]
MFKSKYSTTKLVLPALFAVAGLVGCSQDEDQEAGKEMGLESVSAATAATSPNNLVFRSNHYIVLSTKDKLPAGLSGKLEAANGKVTSLLSDAGVALVYSEDPAFAAKAGKISGVRSVVHDFTTQWFNPDKQHTVALEDYGTPPASGDDDRYFDLQWGHAAIKASEAWNKGYRGKGALVAVLDSGFDTDHPDLAANIENNLSKNFVTGEEVEYKLNDAFSHGTHTAGTIAAADNGTGTIGVAPEARLMLVKVLRDSGSGAFSWIMQGIVYASQNGADVISMSIGAAVPQNGRFLDDNDTPDDPTDDFIVNDTKAVQELLVALSRVTNYATQRGSLLIASAGNEANNGMTDQSLVHLPSGAANVVSISATAPIGWALNQKTTFLDNLASYSNYGIADVHFAAPGGDALYQGKESATVSGLTRPVYVFDLVFSTGSSNSYYWSAGTSMAAPHAAGVAALIVGKNGGQISPASLLSKLRASADDLGKPGQDMYYGYGRVNAERAVSN